MIDPREYDPLMVTTVVSIILGIFVLLVALLVPREQTLYSNANSPHLATDAFNSLAAALTPHRTTADAATLSEPPLPSTRAPSFANAVATASRQTDSPEVEDTAVTGIDEMPAAPLVNLAPSDLPAPAEYAANRRITWPLLVDDAAVEVDLPTRLRLIEGLGFIGGSWSIEILARAYEQELDANVRGAIFVALRDSRSAA